VIPGLLDFAGVAVFAVSGALAAGRKNLDLVGVLVIASVTAIGGGTLRDLLMDRHPVFWVARPAYLYVIVLAALATVAWAHRFRPPALSLAIADALGLAFFTVSGAPIAEGRGLSGIVVVLMGVLTGVAGGVLRDVLSAEIPLVLRRGNLYASCAIAGTSTYFVLERLGLPRPLPSFIGMTVGTGLRLAAIRWGLQLPEFRLERTGEYRAPPTDQPGPPSSRE